MIVIRVTDPDTKEVTAITGFDNQEDADEYRLEAQDAGMATETLNLEKVRM